MLAATHSDISSEIGGVGGQLFAARVGYANAISSPAIADIHDRFVKEGWSQKDPRLARAIALNHPGFVNDGDLMTPDEIARDDVYNMFYRKFGVGYMAGTMIYNPTGDSIAFAFQRHQDKGPVPRDVIAQLDDLRPHLARASMLSFRIGFDRARAQVEALQLLGLPCAVLRNRVLAANALFEALMPSLFQDRAQRVAVTDTAADLLLADALAAISMTGQRDIKSIAVAATRDRVPMILHLLPVRGAAHDIFMQATSLLLVTPVDQGQVPTAEVLQGLFDLTPAEARVARGISEARTIEAIAAAQNVSRETVRTQVKAVLAKTGLNRQSQLVSLLAGIMLMR